MRKKIENDVFLDKRQNKQMPADENETTASGGWRLAIHDKKVV
jgi:hypothetical protein